MSEARQPHRELRELLAAVAEGRVDEAGRVRLNALLADDADARAMYIDYVTTDAMLRWLGNADAPYALAAEPAPTPQREAYAKPAVAGRIVPIAAAAAVLIAAALLVALSNVWRGPDQPAGEPAPVAVLADAGDLVVIESTGEPAIVGGKLRPGWLQVPAGVAEVSFDSGAVVRIEGPARLRLDTARSAEFDYGRLAAHVPAGASGFTVRVGEWNVVDLGTAFGIEARSGGTASVQVFEGVVRVAPSNGSNTGRRLTARQAVAVAGATMSEVAYDRAPFGGLLMELLDAELPEPPVTSGLAMWLSAERGVERDDDGTVSRWRSSVGPLVRQAGQIMIERRPTWLPAGLDGRPCLRFDGDDFLQTPTAASLGLVESDFEMFFVARTDDPDIQFLIAGSYGVGSEQFEVHLNGASGLRFIPRHHLERADGVPTDASYSDLGANAAFVGATHVVEARVDDGVGIAAVDGVESTDAVPDARSLYRGELTLGMRGNASWGLRGELAEVLIYNRALTDEERSAVRAYLRQRHEIAFPSVRDGGAESE